METWSSDLPLTRRRAAHGGWSGKARGCARELGLVCGGGWGVGAKPLSPAEVDQVAGGGASAGPSSPPSVSRLWCPGPRCIQARDCEGDTHTHVDTSGPCLALQKQLETCRASPGETGPQSRVETRTSPCDSSLRHPWEQAWSPMRAASGTPWALGTEQVPTLGPPRTTSGWGPARAALGRSRVLAGTKRGLVEARESPLRTEHGCWTRGGPSGWGRREAQAPPRDGALAQLPADPPGRSCPQEGAWLWRWGGSPPRGLHSGHRDRV